MPAAEAEPTSTEHAEALAAFHPERFGFRRFHEGWTKELPGLGAVAITSLGWQHAHAPSYDFVDGERVPTDALSFLVHLQQCVWGLPPEDLVPGNMLAVLPDTGGASLIAYDLAKGFNAEGWLGFVLGVGARSGKYVSHMLGVREDLRGTNDIGWYLKVIQGFTAVQSGHTSAVWTYDPMRGPNARLNHEKLGAEADVYTIDKYGFLRSALYGENVPTDRLAVDWRLTAPSTSERLDAVYSGRYRGLSLADVAAIPEVTTRSLSSLIKAGVPRLRYRIPGDVDRLAREDPREAVRWRQETREVLGALLTTKSARRDDESGAGPAAVGTCERPGDYVIVGFATGQDQEGERLSYYVLERRRK
jgi:predicted GNAT superfamily acetyltransferase